MHKDTGWERAYTETFWGDIASCNHLVQIYENDSILIDTLEKYVSNGLTSGEAVVLIATSEHLTSLEAKLEKKGFNISTLKSTDHYISFIAEEVLAKLMVNDRPDEKLFNEMVSEILKRSRKGGRTVRVFGEMVVLLWQQGKNDATIALEQLWNNHLDKDTVTLLCAYPKSGFTVDANSAIQKICSTHSKLIDGSHFNNKEVVFKNRTEGQKLIYKFIEAFNRPSKS